MNSTVTSICARIISTRYSTGTFRGCFPRLPRGGIHDFQDCEGGGFVAAKELARGAQLGENLQLVGMSRTEFAGTSARCSATGCGRLAMGKVVEVAAEFHPQILIELVEQVVFGLEIGEQRPLGDTCFFGDGGGWGTGDTAFSKDLQCGFEDCLSFVILFGRANGYLRG